MYALNAKITYSECAKLTIKTRDKTLSQRATSGCMREADYKNVRKDTKSACNVRLPRYALKLKNGYKQEERINRLCIRNILSFMC